MWNKWNGYAGCFQFGIIINNAVGNNNNKTKENVDTRS